MLVTIAILMAILVALGFTIMAQLSHIINQQHDRNEMARESLNLQKRQVTLTEKMAEVGIPRSYP